MTLTTGLLQLHLSVVYDAFLMVEDLNNGQEMIQRH